ncbi:isopentenyl-diphosphate Delta-isomerase [Rubrimonas cliftonensis]|uniref:Isopentenyl-diphosphate Delta-isomerase n=1 Tax=Rubrimonas cliftonensis TaxID=89524 RepID=A0A1H4ADV2_9RHOB|nr:isopentenyl-diphosphate Delta-isomerase [Rubrimonas cliftonensis]SEA34117.1 isopentenyl-diphosphate delta-isomerase [Rubrimonas cliftonensis]
MPALAEATAPALRRQPRGAQITIPAIAGDGSLYPVEKLAAHQLGLRHVAISAFVFDGPRLLIQRRALGKYHCGGLWANTVCSHPHWGESPAAAAARRLEEELGLRVGLSPAGEFDYRADVGAGLIEDEHVHMFLGRAGADAALYPDPEEVAETRWVTREAMQAEIAAAPERFTPWFRIYVGRWPAFDFGTV